MYGLIQSGHIPELNIATIFDVNIMLEAKKEAEDLVKRDPNLKNLKDLKIKIETKENEIHPE
jgi:hypothetical protein